MAEPFLDSLKNIVPSLEKATEINFLLLLTSFVLLADCASLYVHDMNILRLSDIPDVMKPRLAIEAIILVIGFGMTVGIAMPALLFFANLLMDGTVKKLWDRFEIRSDPDGRRFRPASAYSVPVGELREKAHTSKESYYLNLLKEADEREEERLRKIHQTALLAFTVLLLSTINLYAALSPEKIGILAQITDGFGQEGRGWLLCLGCILMVLAFYPVFKEHDPVVYCPELAQELGKKRQQEREQLERFRRESEEFRADPPYPLSGDVGERLNNRVPGPSMSRSHHRPIRQTPND